MPLQITVTNSQPKQTDVTVLAIFKEDTSINAGPGFDQKTKQFLEAVLKHSADFEGKSGQTLHISAGDGKNTEHFIVLGLGPKKELSADSLETAGGKLFGALKTKKYQKAAVNIAFTKEQLKTLSDIDEADIAVSLATGLKLASYSFDAYKTPAKDSKKPEQVAIICATATAVKKQWSAQENVIEGVFWARDLVNEPPNTLYPDAFAKTLKKELSPLGVKIDILDEKKMESLGMGAILGVGQGSSRKPRMVVMRWEGTAGETKTGKEAPYGLVGKGVTFDTGGISIKPSNGMDEMKMDMGGAAAVAGTMKAIALNKLKTPVVGIVGLAENMPSSDAYRPGDILKSYSGKTIEVLNTDAEGRLVLADALTYLQQKFKPRLIIDLATLTGAMMVALGHEYCGTFVNNDKLWKGLEQASRETGEKLWRMPLDDAWKKEMESELADLRNLGKVSRFAGACTAAGFLEHFIEDGTPWAHMDIAGTAWIKSPRPTVPKFGTGFGVRALAFFVEHYKP